MKKLVAVGCSFTEWHFPTTADWLGYCFDEYENLGRQGAGNRYIFNTLFDYITNNDITDTFFFIQWSGIPRRDWMGVGHTNWNTFGCFNTDDGIDNESELNLLQFSTEFKNYLLTTINYFESNDIPHLMVNMLDPWFADFLGDPSIGTVPKHIYDTGIRLIRNSNQIEKIRKYSSKFLQPCLEHFSTDNNNGSDGQVSPGMHDESVGDYHPHPRLALKYCREVIYPKYKNSLPLESIFDEKLDNLIQEWVINLKDINWVLKQRDVIQHHTGPTSYGHKRSLIPFPYYSKNG